MNGAPLSRALNRAVPWQDGWRADVLALLAGIALPLAFAPFDLFPLAVLSLAALFWLWLHAAPRAAFRRGFAYGTGMFGLGVSWVFVSMYDNGGVSLPLSLFLTAVFVLFLALFPGLLGYFIARVFPCNKSTPQRLKLLLVFPAAWVLGEWVRGWFLTGFPWLNLGYSQIDAPLASIAPVLGVYGVSLAVALSAGCVTLLPLGPTKWRVGALVGLFLLWGGATVLHNVSWVQPAGAPLRVSLLQGNIPQNLKWLWDLREPTMELYAKLTRESWGSDLIVWPESAVPALYSGVEDYFDGLAREARDHGSELLIGVIHEEPDGKYYNAVVSAGAGKPQFYYKRHLVPFTEYLPMKNVLGGLVRFMQVPMSDFSVGRSAAPLAVAGQQAAISICYEDAFGEETIESLPQATLLVNVTNDAWFGDSIAPPQHLQIARMRSLEAGRPMLRATNTGMTAVVDDKGRLQSVAPQFETYALHDTVQPMQGSTPYARFGNWVVVTALFVLLIGAWVGHRQKGVSASVS